MAKELKVEESVSRKTPKKKIKKSSKKKIVKEAVRPKIAAQSDVNQSRLTFEVLIQIRDELIAIRKLLSKKPNKEKHIPSREVPSLSSVPLTLPGEKDGVDPDVADIASQISVEQKEEHHERPFTGPTGQFITNTFNSLRSDQTRRKG